MKTAGADCRFLCRFVLLCGLLGSTGCGTVPVRWREPSPHLPLRVLRAVEECDLLRAEVVYSQARRLEKECSEACVDRYFEAVALTQAAHAQCDSGCPAAAVYQAALTRLIVSGQQFGRLDPRSGLSVQVHGRMQVIPISHNGFVWNAEEFDRLEPVGDYWTTAFDVAHRVCGCGVPLVVTSSCKHTRPFLSDNRVFAATAVLRTSADDGQALGPVGEGSQWMFELYDPLRVDSLPLGDESLPLAKDLSAPIAYRLRGQRRSVLDNFFTPLPSEVESRLYTIEPYQPGKVPVVFVHGLLSDPFTWAEMVNQLQATDGFVDHFQIWLFEYPTGEPFLFSAAGMREKLAAARATLDPDQLDPQFSNMVLVGHSMGGLISKLQVTSSGDRLWRSIANRPIEQTVMQPAVRQRMTDAFFFEPSPLVSRVVFIGTPHQGSADARRLVGRVASLLVVEPPQTRENHRQLVDSNPGVFSKEFTRRVPTSIDLLEPDSDLLQALNALPIPDCVSAHSIIGNARWAIGYGPSDGVVPVQSARYAYVDSERYVAATHSKLHKHVESVDELHRVLRAHLQQSQGRTANTNAQRQLAAINTNATRQLAAAPASEPSYSPPQNNR